MSLLTRISKLFSKQQSDQILGISLQQESLTSCAISILNDKNNAESDGLSPLSLQHMRVSLSDFAKAISALNVDAPLAGKCHLVLNAQQSQIVQVDKPKVPADEIVSALKWQVKDLVSISPENIVLDYFDGPILSGGKEKINVVCSPLNELKKLVATINKTDAEVASIVTEEFAFANLMPITNDACLLVCQQPNEEIVLLIVKQGQLYFHRRLRGFSKISHKNEAELSMGIIDSLTLEIQRSSDYFERQLKQAPIKEIKVLLPIELESYFARKLAENTHIPVNLLSLPKAFEQHRDYGAAVGATLFDTRVVERQQAQELSNAS